jgi:hypothetical protein
VFAIHSSVPAKTVTEFIARSKANPGDAGSASAGFGVTQHRPTNAIRDHASAIDRGRNPRGISNVSDVGCTLHYIVATSNSERRQCNEV